MKYKIFVQKEQYIQGEQVGKTLSSLKAVKAKLKTIDSEYQLFDCNGDYWIENKDGEPIGYIETK